MSEQYIIMHLQLQAFLKEGVMKVECTFDITTVSKDGGGIDLASLQVYSVAKKACNKACLLINEPFICSVNVT